MEFCIDHLRISLLTVQEERMAGVQMKTDYRPYAFLHALLKDMLHFMN